MRLVLCVLLALAAAPAWAEWVRMGETDTTTHYANPATIRKNGDLRRVWEIQDLKQRHTAGEMSRRYLAEYDCKDERARMLSLSAHSEPMASGNMIYSGNPSAEWSSIPSGSVAADIRKFVCAK